MALQGDLSSIPIADVFQLVSTTRRTGILYVAARDDARVFQFRSGELVSASSLEHRFRLGHTLCNRGLLTPAALDAALAEQRLSPKRPLGDVLLARGAITMEALKATLRDQIQDSLDDAMHWTDGGFLFAEGGTGPTSAPGGVSFVVQPLLFDSIRKLDEWAKFSGRLDDRTAVVLFAQQDDAGSLPPGSNDVLALMELVDGRRTIGQIVARSPWSEHRVIRALSTLVESRLVKLQKQTDTSKFTIALWGQDRARSLTVAPRAGARAVALATIERVGVLELHAAAMADPGLAVAVLRAATAIGVQEGAQFATLRDAVLALGEDVLRRVLVAAGLRGCYCKVNQSHSFDLWRHSLVTAIAAARIAGALGMPPERGAEAYLAGLLHDVGAMVLRDMIGQNYDQVDQLVSEGIPRADAERRVAGISHDKVGGQTLERWGAAPSIIEAALSHHRGFRSEPWQLAVVCLADVLAAHAGYDAEALAMASGTKSLEHVASVTVGMPREMLERVAMEVAEEAGARDPLW